MSDFFTTLIISIGWAFIVVVGILHVVAFVWIVGSIFTDLRGDDDDDYDDH